MAPVLVQRTQWGARAPRSVTTVALSERTGCAVHHTAGPTSQSVRDIQDFHMDGKGWSDIGYNHLVHQDGRVFVGRGWGVFGAHAAPHNRTHFGFCWIGDGRNTEPSAAAKTSMRWLIDQARQLTGRHLTVTGHGRLPGQSTDCPERHWLAWIAAGMPTISEEDDMPYKDWPNADREALVNDVTREVFTRKVLAGNHTPMLHEAVGDTLAAVRRIERRQQDPDALAAAIVARLPAGSLDVETVRQGVREVLLEGVDE